jgi:hypothetical protein
VNEENYHVDSMMNGEYGEGYFEWLKGQIYIASATHQFDGLLKTLHRKEFVWLIPNDDNRVAEGLMLRGEYSGNSQHNFLEGVSVLEVMVALSRRMAFILSRNADECAWILIENLGLGRMVDPLTRRKQRKIEEAVDTLVWRTYDENGRGGFFPLEVPKEDQTKVEVWYQMSAWINETQEI